MPLNTLMPSTICPRTLPAAVAAIGASALLARAVVWPAEAVMACLLRQVVAESGRGRAPGRRCRPAREKLFAFRGLAVDDGAKQLPLLALQAHQLRLADRGRPRRTGVDRDAGQQQPGLDVLH